MVHGREPRADIIVVGYEVVEKELQVFHLHLVLPLAWEERVRVAIRRNPILR